MMKRCNCWNSFPASADSRLRVLLANWWPFWLLAGLTGGFTLLPDPGHHWALRPVLPLADAGRGMLTGHLCHLSLAHWLTNLLVLALLHHWALRLQVGRLVLPVLLLSALGVNLGLLLRAPQLDWYVGLSGALHGLFAWLALRQATRTATLAALLPWLAGLAKLLAEALLPAAPWQGFRVIYQAHEHGFLAGSLLALAYVPAYALACKRR